MIAKDRCGFTYCRRLCLPFQTGIEGAQCTLERGHNGSHCARIVVEFGARPGEEILSDFWFHIAGEKPPETEIATWMQAHPVEAHKIILRFQLGAAAGELMATHGYTRKAIHQLVDLALDAVPPEKRPSLDLLPFSREYKDPDKS